MAGMLDDLLAQLRAYAAAKDGQPPPVAPAADPAAMAAAPQSGAPSGMAGLLGALGAAKATMPNDPLLAGGPGAMPAQAGDAFAGAPATPQDQNGFGPFPGLLNAPYSMAGGPGSAPLDLPPSTNDPTANEPQVFANGVPLTRPKPISSADTGAAPLSMAPGEDTATSTDMAARSAAQPTDQPADASAQTDGSSFGDKLGKFGGKLVGGIGNILGNMTSPDHAATMLALGAGFSGAPSFGTGMSRAFAGAAPAVAADRANALKMAGISQTYQAVRSQLLAQGKSPTEAGMTAIAAAQNPELLKTLAPKLYGALPPTVHMVTDMMGGQRPVKFDPNTGTMTEMGGQPYGGGTSAAPGSGPQTSAQTFDAIAKAKDAGASQNDLINMAPVELRPYVKALIKGDAVPTNLPMKGNARTNALTLAHAIDDHFDEQLIPMRRTFSTGMGSMAINSFGGQVRSSGTIVKHIDRASQALDTLAQSGSINETLPVMNRPQIALKAQSGDKQFNDALGRWETDSEGAAGELNQLLTGGVGAESAKQEWRNKLDIRTQPLSKVKASLDEINHLMMGRLSQVAQAKERAFGRPTDPISLLGPEEQAAAKRVAAGTYGGQQQAAAPRAAAPAPGNYVYNPATRSLVPAQ